MHVAFEMLQMCKCISRIQNEMAFITKDKKLFPVDDEFPAYVRSNGSIW